MESSGAFTCEVFATEGIEECKFRVPSASDRTCLAPAQPSVRVCVCSVRTVVRMPAARAEYGAWHRSTAGLQAAAVGATPGSMEWEAAADACWSGTTALLRL